MERASHRVILPPMQTMFGVGLLPVDRQLRYGTLRNIQMHAQPLVHVMDEIGEPIFQMLSRRRDFSMWRNPYA